MNQILEICHCGNDRASHFEGKGACLAMACECSSYCDRHNPLPPKASALVRPKGHPSTCLCYVCSRLPKASAPAAPDPVDEIDDTYSPNTHRTGCICAICTTPRLPFYPFPYGAP